MVLLEAFDAARDSQLIASAQNIALSLLVQHLDKDFRYARSIGASLEAVQHSKCRMHERAGR